MKKCPYCKANIEDNANFCLYCMTSLTKKEIVAAPKQKRFGLLAGVIVLVLAICVGVFLLSKGSPEDPQIHMENPTSKTENEPTQTETFEPDSTDPPEEEPVQSSQSSQIPTSPIIHTPQSSKPETTPPETDTEPETTRPETETEPEITETEPEPTQAETNPPAPQSAFAYRLAQRGDDYNAGYENPGNDIVITGVNTISSNGVYHIPSYIDGKRVLTIDKNAFYGSGAKTVYVPSTVRNIFNYAFNGCQLTDIYFYGNSIYVSGNAFYANNATVTIHCSASCNDRSFHTFQNSAYLWNAQWEEWNG